MSQPIANIVLKMDKNGSSIQLKNVTPAEVMLLCALHHTNAGGDPILKLVEIKPDAFTEEVERQEALLAKLREDYEKVQVDPTLMESLRESRLEALQKRIETKESIIAGYRQIEGIRELSTADEVRRLGFKYNQGVLREFFPGRVPALPTTFKEAKDNGIQTQVEAPQWIVGDNKYAK